MQNCGGSRSTVQYCTVLSSLQFKFNEIKSLYTKINFERRLTSAYNILRSIFKDIIIMKKVIYFTITY